MGFFFSCNQIFFFFVHTIVHLFPAGNAALSKAFVVTPFPKLLIFNNNCPTFLKTEQRGKGVSER